MEENSFNNHLSEKHNQPANKNGDNILKESKVVIFKTSDYDLNFNEREAKYKDFDHVLCEKCNQEISKWYFYCKGCRDKVTDSNEKYRMKHGRLKVEIFKTSDYDLDLGERRAKYKDCYCILCETCSQEISKWHCYCEFCYNEETDVKKSNRMKHEKSKFGIFMTSDYDLDLDRRKVKYRDYDHILCEKCIQEIDLQYFYCECCYEKETDNYERFCMKYGRSKVEIFKTSDYDLNSDKRNEKYKNYDHILCEKCNQEINKMYFYCKGCYNKKTNGYERIRMKYGGGSKVGILKKSDYDLNLDERRAKYMDYDHVICGKCNQEIISKWWYYYCEGCYNKETDGYERINIKYGGRSKVGIFKTSDYDLDLYERRAKYKDYNHVICGKCNQEIISKWCCYCEGCYKKTDGYERIRMKYGRSKVVIFKTTDYDLDLDKRKAKYEDYNHILCEKCNQEIDKQYFYCKGCYYEEIDNYEGLCMKYGRSKVGILDYDLDLDIRKAKYKDYDHILCEKCNQEIDKQYFYCKGCYYKEIDNYEGLCMKYGRSKVGIFKTSDYDLDLDIRKAKYKDYDHISCEKCNQEIDKRYFYCKGCYYKEIDNYEGLCLKYGRSKVGIFKTSDYDLDLVERKAKYKDYDHILCEKCNEKINESYFYCEDCYKKETGIKERNRIEHGKYENSEVEIFKASDYDLNYNERKAKYRDYNHILCEKCNQEINQWYFYCKGCYNKQTNDYDRIRIKYGRSKVEIFKISDYDLDLDERKAKYRDYDHVICGTCNQEINKSYFYCESCYKKETDHNKKNHIGYGKCKKCFQINTYSNGCLPCFNHFLQKFDKWISENKINDNIDNILKEAQVGISDYDLDEEDRQVKYNNYNCILCEKCNQKIYYYCDNCYDIKTKKLKEILLQNCYCKLYDKKTKELKELDELKSILPFKLDYNSKTFMQIINQLNNIKNQIENLTTHIKNIRYYGHHGDKCSRDYYYCNCYDKETDVNEKKRMEFGRCKECFQIFKELDDCLSCRPKHFQKNFDKWTSGNKVIDKLIQDNQLLAKRYGLLEWIPYDKFENIKYIAEGGFAKVYSAIWIDGQIRKWSQLSNNWRRDKSLTIALKVLNNSVNISEDFLNEINFFNKVSGYLCVVKCFGITQDPITHNYALVLQCMENGDLRSNLKRAVTWTQRINIIYDICLALKDIHSHGFIHKDLHPGNIFIDSTFAFIGDFGFCMPANEISSNSNIYGVMPYMAPEILWGHSHTLASDVYSLGVIINEIITGSPPFNNKPHDCSLALGIYDGKRPTIRPEIPKELKELIEKCWDTNPEKRPTSEEIFCILSNQLNTYKNIPLKGLSYSSNELNSTQSHPQAIYTSRLLSFQNLSEAINWPKRQEFISSKNIMQLQTAYHNTHNSRLDISGKKLKQNNFTMIFENNKANKSKRIFSINSDENEKEDSSIKSKKIKLENDEDYRSKQFDFDIITDLN